MDKKFKTAFLKYIESLCFNQQKYGKDRIREYFMESIIKTISGWEGENLVFTELNNPLKITYIRQH